MRVVVISRDNTDYARDVETFVNDFARQTGHGLEVMDPYSTEGDSFCRTYDIVEYPTVAALGNDGQLQQLWRGIPLPTISEVSYYVSQN